MGCLSLCPRAMFKLLFLNNGWYPRHAGERYRTSDPLVSLCHLECMCSFFVGCLRGDLEFDCISSCIHSWSSPGAIAWSEASSLGMQAGPSSIPTSGTFFRGDLVMKTFLRPFSLFRWFKKSSCQLLAKECVLSTGELPRRLAQEQCG